MFKKKLNIFSGLFIAMVSFGLASCVSLNSHQLGRTLGQDNYAAFGSFNFGYLPSETCFTIDSGSFYIAEIGALYGIHENLDAGLKVNSSFYFTWMSKYQFIGHKHSFFASSVGLDVGASPIGALMMHVTSYSGTLSLFNSIHPTDYLAITLAPRYTYLGFVNFMKEYGFTRSSRIYGYSAGVVVGKKHQVSFELSQYVHNADFSFKTKPIISLGYIWHIKGRHK